MKYIFHQYSIGVVASHAFIMIHRLHLLSKNHVFGPRSSIIQYIHGMHGMEDMNILVIRCNLCSVEYANAKRTTLQENKRTTFE